MTSRESRSATNNVPPDGPRTDGVREETLNFQEAEAVLGLLARGLSPGSADLLRTAAALVKERDDDSTEARLRKAEARYRALVEQIPAVTFMAPLDGTTTELYVSPQIEELLGFTAKEWLENPVLWYAQLHPDDKDRWQAAFARTLNAGEHFRSDYRFIARDGRVVWVHGEAKVVSDEDGRPLFLQGVAFDITEIKRAEEQMRNVNAELERRVRERTAQLEAANRELEAFSYSVSHDLRAPLRTIDGFTQALQEDYGERLDAPGQDYMRRVRAATQRMGQLIDGLLDLSRLTRSEMRPQPVDLSALAKAVAADLREREPERDVVFVVAEGLTARGDAQLLRIALENLLGNAWKYTSRRARATIEFGATRRDDETIFFVRDNGAGFDMAYADKLFGTFQRLHAAADFPGTGIGLATVQRIIHRHGGRIWAESAVDHGAAFFFTL